MSNGKPTDFDSYWQNVVDELARYPAAPEAEIIPIRCTDYATMYGVWLTSIGPYRIFAYLSIPDGEGPFPAVYQTASYGSVAQPIPQGSPLLERSRYITFSIASRGQRGAERPFEALYPGLLTEGIDDAEAYIFRGIVADCVRGLEYLISRPELDPERLAVVSKGPDLALATSALGAGVTHVAYAPGPFYKAPELASKTSAYPLEEINDYIRLYPDRKDAVHRTLSYFDPRWFAPQVGASTFIMAGPPGSPTDSAGLDPLIEAIDGEVTVHASEQSSYKDGLAQTQWLTRQFGFEEPILPEHWR